MLIKSYLIDNIYDNNKVVSLLKIGLI
ncbi:uncharacterized protein METZ01_LOCUS16341 [marine metagenome]|uniref:Uncharacterized protein n=1 Tax=marine metagenome TaxID=408172 RepID=A0A381PB01_9ZZZZ